MPEGTVGVICFGKAPHTLLTEGEMDDTQPEFTIITCPACGAEVMVEADTVMLTCITNWQGLHSHPQSIMQNA